MRQNSRPYYFLCTPPTLAAAGAHTAPLHFTPLFFHSIAHVSSGRRKGAFFFLFLFFPAPETTIFPVWRSATLPMGARGGACVIDAPRRQCVFALDIYTNIGLYIMIYWEKETICKIRHSAPPIAEWNDPVFCRRFDYEIGNRIRLLRSNRRIFGGHP